MISQDPVAASIEHCLQQQAVVGGGPFFLREHPDQTTARFGSVTASGETSDIALVRLARRLLDEPRYRAALMKCLRVHTSAPNRPSPR